MVGTGTPTQRTTRSVSNSTSITLNEIKTLIDKSNAEILKTVKDEIQKYGEKFDSLLTRIDEMSKQNEQLESRVRELEQKVASTCMSNTPPPVQDPFLEENVIREAEERHKRRKYVIISGLQEPSTGSPEERRLEDEKSVLKLAKKIGVENLEVGNASRLGSLKAQKPRLLRLKCSTFPMKTSLLRAARNLRREKDYENVFINPDLTKLQRENDKMLRTELKARRRAGEQVVIRSGRIVNPDINPTAYSYRGNLFR